MQATDPVINFRVQIQGYTAETLALKETFKKLITSKQAALWNHKLEVPTKVGLLMKRNFEAETEQWQFAVSSLYYHIDVIRRFPKSPEYLSMNLSPAKRGTITTAIEAAARSLELLWFALLYPDETPVTHVSAAFRAACSELALANAILA
jgi:hypothetical protein